MMHANAHSLLLSLVCGQHAMVCLGQFGPRRHCAPFALAFAAALFPLAVAEHEAPTANGLSCWARRRHAQKRDTRGELLGMLQRALGIGLAAPLAQRARRIRARRGALFSR